MTTLTQKAIQTRLFIIAGCFITLLSIGLTIAPNLRNSQPDNELVWSHWIGLFVWLILAGLIHKYSFHFLPRHDPYLLPAAFLLCGWGLLSIYRLFPYFGFRQTAWFAIAVTMLLFGLKLPADLAFLRKYKYIWLSIGLLITALTIFFGTNPSGYSEQRLWLGCCGFYIQPSEPLKLLLIIYLSAYLADRFFFTNRLRQSLSISGPLLTILAPTLFMTGIALLLLVVQRDLGTAFIFIFIYTAIVFMATNERKVLVAAALSLVLASLVGFFMFGVVRTRFEAWLNPWVDPGGRSYQIVQSILAISNGNIFGQGPGLGSPSLVPVPHSDFIFTTITEEAGLFGAICLLLIIGLMFNRGIVIAINSSGYFRRYLAAGITVFLSAQSLLIIGGNINLVPLTGVTLPFVSYGGSSLVISCISLLLLLLISSDQNQETTPLSNPFSYLFISVTMYLIIITAIGYITWWVFFHSFLE